MTRTMLELEIEKLLSVAIVEVEVEDDSVDHFPSILANSHEVRFHSYRWRCEL